ncbi:peroxynitrite isomerase THAP4-like [Rhopilema esculentum]|uniref:peroxynitrite isomerase THAP4-like n=1 Tax=Rhopilema esculentum TaxID=499914 RepID=UPI0031D89D35|eukprot:gene15968-7300_t
MVRSCCAVGCANRQEGEKKNLTFYRIPKGRTPIEKRRRQDWLRAIRRDDWRTWSDEKISKAFICAEHFISGKRSDNPDDANWIPTIFQHSTAKEIARVENKIEKKARYEVLRKKRVGAQAQWMVTNKTNTEATHSSSSDDGGESRMCDAYTQFDPTDTNKEITVLKDKISLLDKELRAKNAELCKLREENRKLKMRKFHLSLSRDQRKNLIFI